MDELTKIQEVLQAQEVNLKEVNLLFLDLSSTCTGYSVAKCNFENKTAEFINAGCIWFNDSWDHAEKYHYMYQALVNYFNIVCKTDFVVMEHYSINPNRMSGCLVTPELHGSCKVALKEVGISYTTITPQQWRKALEVKPTVELVKGKKTRDYKEPTKQKILTLVQVPETVKSNITGQDRQTPSDIFDSLGIGIGSLKGLGFKHISFKNIKFQESIEY